MFHQGKKFEHNQKKYNKLVPNFKLISVGHLDIVSNLKSSKYSNISENFTSAESTPMDDKNLEETNTLEALEGEFNQNTAQYIKLYKTYLEDLSSRQSSLNSTLRSKVVSYDNSNYYINNVGTAREFSVDSWKGKDDSCSESSVAVSPAQFSKLSMGPPMNVGELCRSGGYNAKDTSSGTTSWVDNLGFKHLYKDFINRHPTCPAETSNITSIQYNGIPQGGSYGPEDICQSMSLDSPTHDKLVALNQKLLRNVTAMKNEVNKLATDDVNLDNNIKKQKIILSTTYQELIKEQKKIKKMRDAINQYSAAVTEQKLSVSSIQMHHLIWVVMGGAFIATAIYNSNN